MLDNVLEDKSLIFLADSNEMTSMQQMKKELGKEKTKFHTNSFGECSMWDIIEFCVSDNFENI